MYRMALCKCDIALCRVDLFIIFKIIVSFHRLWLTCIFSPHKHVCSDAWHLRESTKTVKESLFLLPSISRNNVYDDRHLQHNYYIPRMQINSSTESVFIFIYFNGPLFLESNLMICTEPIGVTRFRSIDFLCVADWSVPCYCSVCHSLPRKRRIIKNKQKRKQQKNSMMYYSKVALISRKIFNSLQMSTWTISQIKSMARLHITSRLVEWSDTVASEIALFVAFPPGWLNTFCGDTALRTVSEWQ